MSYEAVPAENSAFISDQAKRNIKGWYFYCFSSEPFIVSAVSTYVPLLLEQFGRINGVKLDDHSLRCEANDDKCVLPMFNGRWFIDTSSFALYTFSLSVLFQTLLVISVSGIVDKCQSIAFKKRVLLFFGTVGALATWFIGTLRSDQYYVLPLLAIVGNCSYGVINVVGNSLLPVFVGFLVGTEDQLEVDIKTSVISGRGASYGYFSALIVQLFSILLVKQSKNHDNLQIAILFVGLWWLMWQIPIAFLLQDIPRDTDQEQHEFTWANTGNYMEYGWNSLWESLKHARLLKDVVIFLIGWFIISDSLTTINSTAILFAKTELKMTAINLITLSIITMVMAMLGAVYIPHLLSERLRLPLQQVLIIIIIWSSVIPLYGMTGFVFQNIGLKHKFEMYILGVWYGVSLGGLAAVSRSLFSLLVPRGKESTFFSLFSVTDKGSSILGPLLTGLITDKTHNIRYAFYLLFLFLVVSLPVFHGLDVERGKREARQLSTM
ncbi:Atg22 [Kluyveromyces lactis]|nr:Atg22 [Kluyveromyces lactis]